MVITLTGLRRGKTTPLLMKTGTIGDLDKEDDGVHRLFGGVGEGDGAGNGLPDWNRIGLAVHNQRKIEEFTCLGKEGLERLCAKDRLGIKGGIERTR